MLARALRCGLLALLAGCSPEQPPPDVFLLSVDTLRADHLPIYGHDHETAPWVGELAERGVLFEAASATTSWTVPSVGSMLTGLLPIQTGLSPSPSDVAKEGRHPALPGAAHTLAEHLSEHGYGTYAVVANAHLIEERGFAQGFDRYVEVDFRPHPAVERQVRRMAPVIRGADGPAFVWVHLFDPHDPYHRQDPWLSAWDPSYTGYAPRSEGGEPLEPLHRAPMTRLKERPDLASGGAGLAHLRALYDSEIRVADQSLAELAGILGIDDDDVVVVVADHGEEFREHGHLGHRWNLHEETVRVPLVVAAPGLGPRRVAERVSIASLPATLADLAGVPAFPEASADSLLPLLKGQPWKPRHPVVAELDAGGPHRALYDGRYKLIDAPTGLELYDLDADPGEQADRAEAEPERVAALEQRLSGYLQGRPVLEPAWIELTLEPSVQEQLEAMGYLAPASDGDDAD